MRKILLLNLIVLLYGTIKAQNCEIEHITDRIISCKCNFNEAHRAFYIVSKDGIVLIDTYYYPWLAEESKDLVCDKIGRNDFIYLLHTHGHGCHVGGNYIYKDIPIIAHDNAIGRIESFKKYNLNKYNQLKEECLVDSSKINELKDYEMLVNIPLPTKTFSDSILIELSDLTIEMRYFGFSGHSNDEVLIFIPEEKTLIIGQIFSRSYFLPVVKESCTVYDLERKVAVLSDFISKDIEYVLSNHQGKIKMEDLIFARDYLADLLTLIPTQIKEGNDLNYIKNEFRLDIKYPELVKRHKISENIVKNNDSNIESVWKMINKNGN